jgi:RimJ/RimL family protein N-acetyltransferase
LTVSLRPWEPGDLELLRQLVGDPAMMVHLGGPEPEERIAERHRRYLAIAATQFKILAGDVAAGWVGYWERAWREEPIYETGWSVLPAFQGRGLATAAMRDLLPRVPTDRRYLGAFPNVENAASNAVCRKLGFTLEGPEDFEYRPGHALRCNVWRLDLRPPAPARTRPSP